jgi:outer membrane protein assembly factor BamE
VAFTIRALVASAAFALVGCDSVPQLVKPYRMEIQQGNFVSQEMVSQLKPGMSKEQVRFVLGTPLLTDVFHPDRWDYVYTRDPRDGTKEQRRLAVYFNDGRLVRVDGDIVAAGSAPANEGRGK